MNQLSAMGVNTQFRPDSNKIASKKYVLINFQKKTNKQN